jgi:hypothetical protein
VVLKLEPSTEWYQKHLGFQQEEIVTLADVRIAFVKLQEFQLEIVEHKRAFTREDLEKRIPEMKHLDNPLGGILETGVLRYRSGWFRGEIGIRGCEISDENHGS